MFALDQAMFALDQAMFALDKLEPPPWNLPFLKVHSAIIWFRLCGKLVAGGGRKQSMSLLPY